MAIPPPAADRGRAVGGSPGRIDERAEPADQLPRQEAHPHAHERRSGDRAERIEEHLRVVSERLDAEAVARGCPAGGAGHAAGIAELAAAQREERVGAAGSLDRERWYLIDLMTGRNAAGELRALDAEQFLTTGDHTIVVGRVTDGEVIRAGEMLIERDLGWEYAG